MENASVQRGLFLTFRGFPSSVRAVGPATFPVGEGDLRRGREEDGGSADIRSGSAREVAGGCGHPPLREGEGRGGGELKNTAPRPGFRGRSSRRLFS